MNEDYVPDESLEEEVRVTHSQLEVLRQYFNENPSKSHQDALLDLQRGGYKDITLEQITQIRPAFCK